MSLLFVTMIVVIIILLSKNNNLKNENDSLKVMNFNRISFCPKCGFDFRNFINKVNFCPKCGHNFNQAPPVYYQQPDNSLNTVKREKYTDKEIKNSLMMITGAILIVLAAIIFLTSTWSVTHNIIKTGVIVFMLVVFLAISYISKKYLNLKQTSKTFYYIALAYIPIILLSISMFSLFGNYLSLYGSGKYIYLTISSILVALIYYIDSKKHYNKLISIFSVVFQMLSIIFLMLIFTKDITLVFIGLLLYSILFSILYMMNKIYFNKNVHLNLCTILFVGLSSLVVCNNYFSLLFVNYISNIIFFDFIAMILLFFNMYLLLIKI